MAVPTAPKELDEYTPAVLSPGEDVVYERMEELDCADTMIPTTYPLVPGIGPCGKCFR